MRLAGQTEMLHRLAEAVFQLLLRALFLRRYFFDLCDSTATSAAGKRPDIDSGNLIQSVPEPEAGGVRGDRPSAYGFFFGFYTAVFI